MVLLDIRLVLCDNCLNAAGQNILKANSMGMIEWKNMCIMPGHCFNLIYGIVCVDSHN